VGSEQAPRDHGPEAAVRTDDEHAFAPERFLIDAPPDDDDNRTVIVVDDGGGRRSDDPATQSLVSHF
jgi:hypothetical protein